MFRFKSLDKIVRDIADKVDAARLKPAVADRVENLLAARDEADARFKTLERKRGDIGMGSFLGFAAGAFIMIGAAVSGAALLASPLFFAGAALTAASSVTLFVFGMSMDPLRADRDIIRRQIHRDVLTQTKIAPKEADKSPRYLRSLTCVFDAAAADDRSYDQLVDRLRTHGAKSRFCPAKA
jgi:hypothetical protein